MATGENINSDSQLVERDYDDLPPTPPGERDQLFAGLSLLKAVHSPGEEVVVEPEVDERELGLVREIAVLGIDSMMVAQHKLLDVQRGIRKRLVG